MPGETGEQPLSPIAATARDDAVRGRLRRKGAPEMRRTWLTAVCVGAGRRGPPTGTGRGASRTGADGTGQYGRGRTGQDRWGRPGEGMEPAPCVRCPPAVENGKGHLAAAFRAPGGEILERETGFEPATSTLARLHSTTELLPPLRAARGWGETAVPPCGGRATLFGGELSTCPHGKVCMKRAHPPHPGDILRSVAA